MPPIPYFLCPRKQMHNNESNDKSNCECKCRVTFIASLFFIWWMLWMARHFVSAGTVFLNLIVFADRFSTVDSFVSKRWPHCSSTGHCVNGVWLRCKVLCGLAAQQSWISCSVHDILVRIFSSFSWNFPRRPTVSSSSWLATFSTRSIWSINSLEFLDNKPMILAWKQNYYYTFCEFFYQIKV